MSAGGWAELFPVARPVIGVLHLPALPGAPRYRGQAMEEIVAFALADARAYAEGGIDGLIVENQGDVPFARPEHIGPSTVAAMTAVATAVRQAVTLPIGINCMANGAVPAIAVAKAVGARFVRVSQWVNAYVGNSGITDGAAPQALRFRSAIRADDVLVFADVHVKHGSHAIVAGRSLAELAEDTAWYGADALVVTGASTGLKTKVADVDEVRLAGRLPVLVGSGIDAGNAAEVLGHADGAIVGTSLKSEGIIGRPVDPERVRALMDVVRPLRG